MTAPLISCIVPVFNGERYLREALDSIFAQTYQPIEIIVVNDGSTDGTAAVVSAYGQRVRSLWQSNAGPPAARDCGVRAAQGEFVAFLDADDLWHPEKLARQMARFAARPELALCVTHLQNFWVPELLKEAEHFRDHRLTRALPGYASGTLLARRTLFEAIGQFNTTLRHGGDTDWFLRAAEHGAVAELLPDVLTYRRLHHNNRSRLRGKTSRDEFLQIVKAHLDRQRKRSKSV